MICSLYLSYYIYSSCDISRCRASARTRHASCAVFIFIFFGLFLVYVSVTIHIVGLAFQDIPQAHTRCIMRCTWDMTSATMQLRILRYIWDMTRCTCTRWTFDESCLNYMSQLHVSTTCLNYMSQLHVSTTCLNYMSQLQRVMRSALYLRTHSFVYALFRGHTSIKFWPKCNSPNFGQNVIHHLEFWQKCDWVCAVWGM